MNKKSALRSCLRNIKGVNLWASLILFFFIILFSCNNKTAKPPLQEAPQTTVVSPRPRLISAAPSNTEIIAGLGMADCFIAVDRYSQRIAGVRPGLPEIDFFNPDTEAIIAMDPDIIFVNEINNYGQTETPWTMLEKMGITIAQIPAANSVDEIYKDIDIIARRLNTGEKGEALIAKMRQDINAVAVIGKTIKERKTVYFEIESTPSLITFGKGVFLNELIETIGAENIFSDLYGWKSVNEEMVIARDPDVILTTSDAAENAVDAILKRPGFENITAVKTKQIYYIDADSASRAAQNITLALNQMAKAVYPSYYEKAQ